MPSFLQNLPYNIEDSWGVVKREGRKLKWIGGQALNTEDCYRRSISLRYGFCSVVLNVPFCPIGQKLRKKQSEVSMVKIPQHKVTKSIPERDTSSTYSFFCSALLYILPVFYSFIIVQEYEEESRDILNCFIQY